MVLVSGLFQFGCSNAGRQASARLRTQVHQLEQHLEASKLHVAELESQLVTTGSAQPSVNVELEGLRQTLRECIRSAFRTSLSDIVERAQTDSERLGRTHSYYCFACPGGRLVDKS